MILERRGFDPADIAKNGCRFLSGNGYMGLRGGVSEYGHEEMACANLSGIYHRQGNGWREPINAPHPLRARLLRNGQAVSLPQVLPEQHRQYVNIGNGVQGRETLFPCGAAIREERFASMSRPHLLGMRWEAEWTDDAEYQADSFIDRDIWDLNGPHLERWEGDDENLLASTDDGKSVAVSRKCTKEQNGRSIRLTVLAAVFTSQDGEDPLSMAQSALTGLCYEELYEEQNAAWKALWDDSRVSIEGDEEAQFALNYSLYHLWCIAPRLGGAVSIGARGLSGQTYRGAVFWDTEMFMLDFYLRTRPAVAKTLLKYRIATLPGALEKALHYGLKGAFYAWESQEGGYDACSDYNVTDVFTGRPMRTFFRDKQVHITAAVVYGLEKYAQATGDLSLYEEGGLEVLRQAALFYESLLMTHPGSDVYEILDVIGPDEYHERVNNNAYTNEMARFTLRCAAKRLREAGESGAELERFERAASRIKAQQPDENGVIAQFDGYFDLEDASVEQVRSRLLHPKEYWGGAYGVASHTQVIKQADVIAMQILLGGGNIAANYDYYCPRTEHGSSLSACMYAQAACRIGRPDDAYPLFMTSAKADLNDGGKEWAGLLYIGGTHPAAAGGAYQTLLYGFLGMDPQSDSPVFHPSLPKHWKAVEMKLSHRGHRYAVRVSRNGQVKLEQF